jgi:hypothetical protein
MAKKHSKKKRKKKEKRVTSQKQNYTDLQPLVRIIVVTLAGVLFYLSLFRAIILKPDITLPLVCGLFIGISLKNWKESLITGILVAFISSVLIDTKTLNAMNLPQSLDLFFLSQLIRITLAAFIGSFLLQSVRREYLVFILLALILLNFGLIAQQGSSRVAAIASTEPPAEAYSFDGIFFEKVYYLVKRGMSFYKAYDEGFRQDARFDTPPAAVSGWRMPTLFWLWSPLPNGRAIVSSFILLSIIAMFCAFFAVRRFIDPVLSLLAPTFLSTYLLFGIVSWWHTELEYWALFFALPAITLYLYNQRIAALPFAALASLIREWMIAVLLAGLIDNLFHKRKRESMLWGGTFVLVIAAYALNLYFVVSHLKSVGIKPVLLSGGLFNGGIGFILYTIQFGSSFFVKEVNFLYLLFFTGLFGVLYFAYKERKPFFSCVALLPLIAFLFYGTGKVPGDPPGWADYYNINFMPFLLVAVPFSLAALNEEWWGKSASQDNQRGN